MSHAANYPFPANHMAGHKTKKKRNPHRLPKVLRKKEKAMIEKSLELLNNHSSKFREVVARMGDEETELIVDHPFPESQLLHYVTFTKPEVSVDDTVHDFSNCTL